MFILTISVSLMTYFSHFYHLSRSSVVLFTIFIFCNCCVFSIKFGAKKIVYNRGDKCGVRWDYRQMRKCFVNFNMHEDGIFNMGPTYIPCNRTKNCMSPVWSSYFFWFFFVDYFRSISILNILIIITIDNNTDDGM